MLISEIAKDLGILRENHENETSWQYRVKYSAVGFQVLASLYDKNDDLIVGDESLGDTVSHQYVTGRASRISQIYGLAEVDTDRILELYKKTGYILSKRNRLTYPKTTTGRIDESYLARGVHPSNAIGVSGICMITKYGTVNDVSIDEMFDLPQPEITEWFAKFLKTINNWRPFKENAEVEYLNINEAANKGYWSGRPPMHGEKTLCRSRSSDKSNYRILSGKPSGVECATLPDRRTCGEEYYRMAIALRVAADNRPKVWIRKHCNTVSIKYNYLLPPAEQSFIELCSWRKSESDDKYTQRLHRVVAINLYQVVSLLFAKMGYVIEEE